MELPPRHESGVIDEVEMFDPSNWQRTWFRPHHGVHVGIGRNPKRFRHLYQADYYQDYFEQLLSYDGIGGLFGGGRAKNLFDAAVKGYYEFGESNS